MVDLDELERLAREAPPGPWRYNGYFVEDANGNEVRTDAYNLLPYIAAASPDVILDLIARALVCMLHAGGGVFLPNTESSDSDTTTSNLVMLDTIVYGARMGCGNLETMRINTWPLRLERHRCRASTDEAATARLRAMELGFARSDDELGDCPFARDHAFGKCPVVVTLSGDIDVR